MEMTEKKFQYVVIALLAVCLLAICYLFVTGASNGKVGMINSNAIFANYAELQQAQAQMQQFVNAKQAEVQAKVGNETDRAKVQAIVAEAQQQIQQKQDQVMKPVTDKVRQAVEAAAKAKGVKTVLELGVVSYGGIDLTQDVLKNLGIVK